MGNRFLLYGATGYTGKLIAEYAHEWNLEPLLAGRNLAKIKALAETTGFDYRVFSLTESEKIDNALQEVDVVVHTAGPFSATAVPMVNACLRTKTHYLDITGEIDVFETLASQNEEAKGASIMVLPGVGFDVVPSDCLAAHVVQRLPNANKITLAINALSGASRGTMKTMMENIHMGARVRENGEIKDVNARTGEFDFGRGRSSGLAVAWGDVSTAYYSTGVENIEVYFQATPSIKNLAKFGNHMGWLTKTKPIQSLLRSVINKQPEGPKPEVRDRKRSSILCIAEDSKGNQVSSRLETPEGYKLTYMATLSITQKVLAGDFKTGFQTPSLAYGADLILELAGTTREDL